MSALLPEQRALADACGVATEYWDWRGQLVEVSQRTVVAVLASLGQAASTAEDAARALHDLQADRWRRPLPPCTVHTQGAEASVWVHVPHGQHVRLSAELEDGRGVELEQVDRPLPPTVVDGVLVGEATFRLPGDLPLGWHRILAAVGGKDAMGPRARVSAPLVVVPQRLNLPAAVEAAPVSGVAVQLYATRSRRSWGYGDLGDLRDLASWAGHDLGLDFVLVNPLHAPSPAVPLEPSPYLPTTRRFPNPLYLRLEDVPELADLNDHDRARFDELANTGQALTDGALLDPDAVWSAKRQALDLLAGVALRPGRAAAYQAFVEREGGDLRDFADWCAKQEGGPEPEVVLRSQWWLDEQLAAVQQTCLGAGMALGMVHDLAVGVHRQGFDADEQADVLAAGVAVGAPPDAYNQLGQTWDQPPFHPGRLAESGYAAYRDMLSTVLRHAGGIRVDHIIGLFRLWWIPEGALPTEGTYVRCDDEALLGILLLEAARACDGRGAVVIGEDLGTVEPSVRERLSERGVLGTSVLWFERDWSAQPAEPLDPQQWRRLCLASVTTHDLPPTMGYLRGSHVDLRADLGLFERAREVERADFERERADWVTTLRQAGLLEESEHDDDLLIALYAFLARTPSLLRAVSLSDLVGDLRPVNQPGTHREYPNWRIPLTDQDGRPVLLDDLVLGRVDSHRVRRVMAALGTVTP